jgi:hypothetical protein
MSKLPAPIALGCLASLLSGCPDPAPVVETESSSSGDTTSGPPATTLPPTTLDSSGTTVGIDTSTTTSGDTSTGTSTGNDSSSGSSSGDTTTGGVVCEEPFEPNEDIGSAVGLAVAMGTNLGAGDHLEDLCGLRTFGFETDTDFSDTDFSDTDFSGTGIFTTGFSDTGIFPGTTDFSGTGIFTTSFSDTGIFPGTTGFSDTDIFPGTTSFSDTGFDTDFQAPTYEEYLIRWTAPAAGNYRFDLSESDYDTLLGITDACGTSELGCNDDCNSLQSQLSLDLAADQTIMIIIGGYSGQVGNFVLDIEEDAPSECKL